jgi:proteic killer suppression protein
LHKLKGARKAQWVMTVNGPWRICFRFARGDAHNVEIVDYHKALSCDGTDPPWSHPEA